MLQKKIFQKKKFRKVTKTKKINKHFLLAKKKLYRSKYYRFLATKNSIYKGCKILSVKVLSNNIFYHLRSHNKKKTILKSSSEKYKIKVTKKRLKFVLSQTLLSFFKEAKRYLFTSGALILSITGPRRTKKKIIKFFLPLLSSKIVIIRINSKKCFNGCRANKKKRKKRQRMILLK